MLPNHENPSDQGPWQISLSPEEERALKLLAEGRPNKEITDELGVSVATARRTLQSVLEKLRSHAG